MPSLFNILRSHNKRQSNSSLSSSPLKERKSEGIFRTKEKDGKNNKSATTADNKAAAQRTIEAVITYSLSEEDEDGAADDSSPVSCDSITFPNLRDLKGESIVYRVGDNHSAFFRETNANDNTVVEIEVPVTNGNGRQVIDIDTELLLNTTVEYGTELLNTTMEELYSASNDDTATELVHTTVEDGTELLHTTIEYATSEHEGGRTTTTEGEETTKNEVNTLISFLPSLCSDLLLLDEVELARSDVTVSTTKDAAANNDDEDVVTTEESALLSSDGLVVETTTTPTTTAVATTVDATNHDDVVTTEESTLIAEGLVVETPATTTTTVATTVDDATGSKDSSTNQLQLKNEHMVQTAYAHQEIIHQLKQADEDTKRLLAHKDQEIRQLTQAGEEMKMQITNQDQEMHQLQQQANEDNNKIKKYGTLLAAKDQELTMIKKVLEEVDSNDSNQINHVMQVAHKHKEMIDQFKQAEEDTKIKYVQLLAAQEEEITKIKKVLTKVMSGLS